ncbi:S-layer homology domain-containing protein [Metaplanococcus flavidus]|uniref:S-layer homology domain-containing protein n=1 Tax=Metaplanococcus flavidus TaxID=569883 RepID=A0ABW3LDS9_9BACL
MTINKNKFMTGAITAAMVASAIAPVAGAEEVKTNAEVTYSDVDPKSSHFPFIYKALDYNIMTGYADNSFKPNQKLTRAQVVKALGKYVVANSGKSLSEFDLTDVESFNDVPSTYRDEELYTYSLIVKQAGIFRGDNNNLNGAQLITREQMSQVLVKAFDLQDLPGDNSEVTDNASANSQYRGFIDILSENGVTSVSEYRPKETTTRAQFATFLVRAYEIANAPEPAPEAPEVESAKAVDATTIEVTFDNGEVVEFEVDTLEHGENEVTFEYEGKEYTGTVNYVDEAVVALQEAIAAAEAAIIALPEEITLADKEDVYAADALVEYAFELDAEAAAGIAGLDFLRYALNTIAELEAEPVVASVSAINAKQVEVKFNTAIDASTAVDTDGTLKTGVINVATISGTTVTVDGASVAALSADGKTLTIDTTSGTFNGQYVVKSVEDTIKATTGEFLPVYTSSVFSAKDTVAPAISSVEKLNASNVRVNFSEPLSSAGTWTFKFADGSTAIVTPDLGDLSAGYVDLAIDSNITAGKVISATVLGAADFANNLISPNPTTFTFSKGALDGTAPVVSSVTPNGLNKFELKFSEEVQNLTESDILVDGVARTAADATPGLLTTEAIITQSTTDKTRYTVEIAPFSSAGIHSVGLVADAVTDLSGETSAAFSKVVEFKADTTAPKLTKSEVKTENGVEYLYLTFDESVTEGTVSALAATEVKNYVTVNGTLDLSGLAPVANTDNKQHFVALSSITFDPAGSAAAAVISNSATYTVALTGFTDASNNPLASTSISFKRAADTDLTKPAVLLTDGDSAPYTVDNGVSVIDNDTLHVTFDKALDGASATNKANYTVNGLVVKSATLLPNNVVELKLDANTNTLTGVRNVAISGVKSSTGVLMNAFAASEYFVENVRPTFTAALTQNDEITLTFSENVVNLTNDAGEADFEVNIDGVDVTTFSPAVAVTEVGTDGTRTYTLELSRALTAAEYAKTLTITATDDLDVEDTNENVLSFTSVGVTK